MHAQTRRRTTHNQRDGDDVSHADNKPGVEGHGRHATDAGGPRVHTHPMLSAIQFPFDFVAPYFCHAFGGTTIRDWTMGEAPGLLTSEQVSDVKSRDRA